MASAPDSAKLHELLKSAARELKSTQQELADERDLHEQARKALDAERAKNRELQQQVLDAQQALRKAEQKAEMDAATAAIPRAALMAGDRTGRIAIDFEGLDPLATLPPVQRHAEDSTNVSRLDPEVLEKRVKALDQSLADAEAEAKQHKQRVAALEAELEALKEVARPGTAQVPALDPAAQREADEQRARAEVAEERVAALEAELAEAKRAAFTLEEQLLAEQENGRGVLGKFAAVEAELAVVRETAGRAAELEGQLAGAKARVWELEQLKQDADTQLAQHQAQGEAAQARLAELGARVNQLEHDLAGIRARRDELNVELARAESDRKKLHARVAELEAAVQAVRDEEAKARGQLQLGHQKALDEAEARRAEADGQFQKEKEKHQMTAQRLLEARHRTRELEAQLTDTQAQLANATAAHQGATASLQAAVAQLEKDLAHTSTELAHTNRQYEQLHREMIVLLDQRDEARRQLDALR
ncbi:MAG: hypothetical protein JNJ54_20055 [Myxococcaceae bacterium]|nr:hypothetical protein [Myxococcaceae bacterium]